MKPLFCLLLTAGLFFSVLANDSLNIQHLQAENESLNELVDSLMKKQPTRYVPVILPSKEENNHLTEDLLPSGAALLVGLLALLGTLQVGKRSNEFSQKALLAQIEASKEALTQQIASAKETTEKQITSADEAVRLNFRKEVLSVNRQNWINDLREVVSEIAALVTHHTVVRQQGGKMSADDLMKLNRLILKAELMVNPIKDQQFIDALLALKIACNECAAGNKEDPYEEVGTVITLTKKTLKTEWERVKKGE